MKSIHTGKYRSILVLKLSEIWHLGWTVLSGLVLDVLILGPSTITWTTQLRTVLLWFLWSWNGERQTSYQFSMCKSMSCSLNMHHSINSCNYEYAFRLPWIFSFLFDQISFTDGLKSQHACKGSWVTVAFKKVFQPKREIKMKRSLWSAFRNPRTWAW